MKAHEITLRRNNRLVDEPCRLCGMPCNATGFDFFLVDSECLYSMVCDSCAGTINPDLARIRTEALALVNWSIEQSGPAPSLLAGLNAAQRQGVACIYCGKTHCPLVPVPGLESPESAQLFRCETCLPF
jgi:hypothetical protein